MNRGPEKRWEANSRKPQDQLYYLLYACSKEDREAVAARIRANNHQSAAPLRFSTLENEVAE